MDYKSEYEKIIAQVQSIEQSFDKRNVKQYLLQIQFLIKKCNELHGAVNFDLDHLDLDATTMLRITKLMARITSEI